jgi:LuxR family maltose regulon positive regulatory protein
VIGVFGGEGPVDAVKTKQGKSVSSRGSTAEELLAAARFGLPEPPSSHVSRPRLLDTLARADRVPLVLVSAPAGTGKTSLLAEWVRSEVGHGQTGWITFETGDTAFWPYLLECLTRLGLELPDLRPPVKAEGLLGREPLRAMSAAVSASADRWTVVVDGYEMVSLGIAREVDFLLRHTFGRLRLVFVGRVDPVLPLYRYRLDEELVEIRAADLAFTDDEAAQLLDGLGVRLAGACVHDLNERLKGWAAGLRFAARALADQEDPERSVATVVAQTGDINEYLVGEVLEASTPEMRQFLLDTCVTDQLSTELVEELVGPAGVRTLAELGRSNAFIEPVSEEPGYFRYYPFFRELLRAQLAYESPQRMAELHRRAAGWFRRHGVVDRAITHLAAVPAWDEVATELADPVALARMLLDGPGGSLHDVAFRLPTDLEGRAAHVVRAAVALLAEDGGTCVEELDLARRSPAESAGRDESVEVSLTVLDALRACLADDARTAAEKAADAGRALDAPPPAAGSAPEVQALVQLSSGIALLRHGDLETARTLLHSAAETGAALGSRSLEAECLGYLAVVDALDGHLMRASRTAEESLTAAAEAAMPIIERSPAARVALARVALEQYDLDAAREHVPAATGSRRLSGDPVSRAVAESVVAGLERAAGNTQHALARLEAASADLAASDPWLADYLLVEAAKIGVAGGEADLALHELESVREYDGRETAVVAAAAYTSQGMNAAAEGALAEARGAELPLRVEVPRLLVEVAQESRRKSSGRARVVLARSLRLAATEEMRRPFREATPAVQRLLASDPRLLREHRWLDRSGVQAPPRRNAADGRQTPAPEVVESLTAKELEVLGHLEELLTTEEIAGKMFVSVNTVRTHVRSILRKLGVNRRNAAVRKARDLGMLAG